MRTRVDWVDNVDDAILEFLAALGMPGGQPVALNTSSVFTNVVLMRTMVERSENTVMRRLKRLHEMGLVDLAEREGKYYHITEFGRAYLSGDLNAEDIPRPGSDG